MSKFLEMIPIALELNKQNHTLVFRIRSNCSIYLVFPAWETCFFKYDEAIATSRLVFSGLGSEYFVILKECPLMNNNQQSNLPRKKTPKDLKCRKYPNLVRTKK